VDDLRQEAEAQRRRDEEQRLRQEAEEAAQRAREEEAARKRLLRPEVSKRQDFDVVSVVGRGRQATVELWCQRATGEIFAAKVFLRPPAKLADRVADEARMLITLGHPSLVRGFALFLPESAGESAVILMQNCSGGSLAELIKKGSLTATQKNKAIVSLAKGLAFLHSEHIRHTWHRNSPLVSVHP
jgi:serine/threonine protein kinase